MKFKQNPPHLNPTKKEKYSTTLCDKTMSFSECELAILRHAVDESDKEIKQKMTTSPDVKRMIDILEKFLVRKQLICYGGTAINNILPEEMRFYDKNLDVPDYDFYSSDALNDAVELADVYFNEGYVNVEAKSGMHHGTYKVFVNFIPIADVTLLHKELFHLIYAESVIIEKMRYAPVNFLRMGLYLELSRPSGDVSRWEKVLKRLNLLNKQYPMKFHSQQNKSQKCSSMIIQRPLEDKKLNSDEIYDIVRITFVEEGVVFFGGYASSIYARYLNDKTKHQFLMKIPDFDVLSDIIYITK